MHLSISVVIPNYNGRDLLAQNLPSVFEALANAQVDSEIIVADDASTDDSVAFLQTHYPEIIVVVSHQNKGFASNINAGIFKASKDLVFALNTDVKLTADYFLPLLDYFKHPNTFGVTGRVVGWDNDKLQDAAKFPVYSLKGIGGGTNYIPIDLLSTSHNDTSTKTFFVPSIFLSGSNALIDRQKLMELQGFCELFSPYYGEDLELGIRAWRLGYACYYEHAAVCHHPNSVTIKKYSKPEKVKLIASRNKFLVNYIHRNGITLWLWAMIVLLKALFSWVKLDWIFYKSLFLFFQQFTSAKFCKITFAKLQQQRNTSHLTLGVVCKKIRKEINQLKIYKF